MLGLFFFTIPNANLDKRELDIIPDAVKPSMQQRQKNSQYPPF